MHLDFLGLNFVNRADRDFLVLCVGVKNDKDGGHAWVDLHIG